MLLVILIIVVAVVLIIGIAFVWGLMNSEQRTANVIPSGACTAEGRIKGQRG